MVRLEQAENALALSIRDDGTGLPENARSGPGMGLRIMAYRASVIGATFHVERLPGRGTQVVCTLPGNKSEANEHLCRKRAKYYWLMTIRWCASGWRT